MPWQCDSKLTQKWLWAFSKTDTVPLFTMTAHVTQLKLVKVSWEKYWFRQKKNFLRVLPAWPPNSISPKCSSTTLEEEESASCQRSASFLLSRGMACTISLGYFIHTPLTKMHVIKRTASHVIVHYLSGNRESFTYHLRTSQFVRKYIAPPSPVLLTMEG